MGWYDTSYRKLFFDFHSSRHAAGLATGFDADRWAMRLQEADAQAVSVFVQCARGWSYYRKGTCRFVHPLLAEGLDMVEELIAALHRRGLKAIGYHATFPSEPLVDAHPEWRMVDAAGVPSELSICMHSPAFDQWLLPHVGELVALYDLDALFFDGTFAHGVCYCDACRRRFAEVSGGLELPLGPDDATYPAFVDWQFGAYRQIRHQLCAEIHAVKPEMPVSFNWAYTMRMPEVVPDEVGSLMIDIFPDDQCFNGSYQAHQWATAGKPFDIMNSAFLRWWGDWGCKPARAMQQEVATTLANGGLTWIGYQMNERFEIENAVMGELGQTLAFVREREALLANTAPVPYAAVLRSTTSNLCADQPTFFVDETTPRGVHRTLNECMVPYLTLHERGLLERLDDFRLVILPDERHLPLELVSALEGWVQRGGTLIATAFTGTTDAHNVASGELALGSLLGIKLSGRYPWSHGYVNVLDERLLPGTLAMAHMVECPIALVDVVAPDVAVWADLSSAYIRTDGKYLLSRSPVGLKLDHPAITVHPVGAGQAIYVAPELFNAYQTNNQWNSKLLMANLIRATAPQPPVTVRSELWLEVVPRRRQGELIVHLVNHHGDRPVQNAFSPSAEHPLQFACVQYIPPVRDVAVEIPLPRAPRQVTLEPGGAQPEWSYTDGLLVVEVPKVDIHTAICVQE
jgi:hypothetical protein